MPEDAPTLRPGPSRSDRFIRTTAFVLLGPVLTMVTPVPFGTAAFLAGTALSSSVLAGFTLPRRLTPALGRIGALMAATLLLGGAGTLLGALDGCAVWSASCRSALGLWTLVWMLLPVSCALLRTGCSLVLRFLRRAPHVVVPVLRRLLRRLVPR